MVKEASCPLEEKQINKATLKLLQEKCDEGEIPSKGRARRALVRKEPVGLVLTHSHMRQNRRG